MEEPSLVGASEALNIVRAELDLAAVCDAKVLITGPSGVGKDVVARLLHARSPRRTRPYVPVNCAAVPDKLLESELFGHTRGSFTDAVNDKKGLFEIAQGGTVFLDEIGEMSLRMQALLLRFLENGEIQRVGAERITVVNNVRVVAATNRNLMERIEAREFREDLFYRINVIHMTIPALRERRADIAPIWQHCVRVFTDKARLAMPVTTPATIEALEQYHWPGNVRELRNVVERVCYRAPTLITPALLPSEVRLAKSGTPPATVVPAGASVVPGASVASVLMRRMVEGGESFWDVAYAPFMTRDVTREDLRQLILGGLEQTRGSYKALVRAFNMEADDYRRFLNFLRKYDCHMPFQKFRMLPPRVEREDKLHRAAGW